MNLGPKNGGGNKAGSSISWVIDMYFKLLDWGQRAFPSSSSTSLYDIKQSQSIFI